MTTPLDTPPVSGQWEQYVEKAAVSIDPAAFDETIENHDGLIRKFRRDRATELAQGVLAVVGPLIAEDTRDRMVEAAAAAVKREGGNPWIEGRQSADEYFAEESTKARAEAEAEVAREIGAEETS